MHANPSTKITAGREYPKFESAEQRCEYERYASTKGITPAQVQTYWRDTMNSMRMRLVLGRENFLQLGDAEKLQNTRGYIREFQNAETLFDRGSLQADQRA